MTIKQLREQLGLVSLDVPEVCDDKKLVKSVYVCVENVWILGSPGSSCSGFDSFSNLDDISVPQRTTTRETSIYLEDDEAFVTYCLFFFFFLKRASRPHPRRSL